MIFADAITVKMQLDAVRGPQGEQGIPGPVGPAGPRGIQGERGERGESAYEGAIRLNLTNLSEEEWLREYDTKRDNAIKAIEDAGEQAESDVKQESASAISAIEAKKNAALAEIPADYTQLASDVSHLKDIKADAIIDTSAKAASHSLHAQDAPMHVTLYGQTYQAGSGDPSPDNVRPISGVDAARVQVSGKNIFSTQNLVFASRHHVDTYTLGPDYVEVAGDAGEADNWGLVSYKPKYPILPGTYTLSFDVDVTGYSDVVPSIVIRRYKEDGKTTKLATAYIDAPATFTLEEPSMLRIDFSLNDKETGLPEARTVRYHSIQLEIGSVATPYEPYNANAIDMTAALNGEPLYDDDIIENDVLVDGERKCRITRRCNRVYVKDLTINSLSSVPGILFFTGLQGANAPFALNKAYCDRYKTIPGNWSEFQKVNNSFNVLDGQIGIRDDNAIGTLTEVRAYFAASEAYIVYPLATPEVYYTDRIELRKPAGIKKITVTGSGEIEVTYARDTEDGVKSTVTAIIGATENGVTATRNYSVGAFIVDKSTMSMYRATKAISSGEAIVPGTNCTATTVVEQLAAIYDILNA